ncbi:MAG: segregation/condensation protein A [bacterium]
MPYQYQTETFSGPLDLLLRLIEKEELDITKVSLAEVTDSFLSYLLQLKEKNPTEVADFLVVATRLLYIKSSLLLPEPELELESGFDLETQLKIYKDFAAAASKVNEIWNSKARIFCRERPFKLETGPKFRPPEGLTKEVLRELFEVLLNKMRALTRLPEASLRKVVSLTEKVEELQNLIQKRRRLLFKDFLGPAESKQEVVVGFMALLELIRRQEVLAEQEAAFCDIVIKAGGRPGSEEL